MLSHFIRSIDKLEELLKEEECVDCRKPKKDNFFNTFIQQTLIQFLVGELWGIQSEK